MKRTVAPIRRAYGGPVFEENPTAADLLRPLLQGQSGRPRANEKAQKVVQLRGKGMSWRVIRDTLNQEYGLRLTTDAYRHLCKAYETRQNQPPRRSLLFLELRREAGQRVLKGRGRPRKDSVRLDAQQLRDQHLSWGRIAVKLNKKYGQELSPEAYRKLCARTPKPLEPWRKLKRDSSVEKI
jgi:hypothetical protein